MTQFIKSDANDKLHTINIPQDTWDIWLQHDTRQHCFFNVG